MKPLVLNHPACLLHNPGPGHPETAARLEAALRGAQAGGALVETTTVRAERTHLVAAHTDRWVDALLSAEGRAFEVDEETGGSAESVDAALWAAGAVLDGVQRLFAGSARPVLAWVRPPGHHAERGRGMGFCFVNNVAVGVYEALRLGAARVAVVDVDVHFGNGTQHIFAMDPRVLVIDLHEDNLYPAGGGSDERGVGAGRGFTINVPLRGAGDADYLRVLDGLVAPALRLFGPELLVVSLGFDAHSLDPLAHMRLSSEGYGLILGRLAAVAESVCGGRLLVVLEGGYHPEAVEASSRAVVEALSAAGSPAEAVVGVPPGWTLALVELEEGLERAHPPKV